MDRLHSGMSSWHLAVLLVLASLLYFTTLVVWRLYFSPTAGFPGSRLAAATGWYESYYDYWLNGQYMFEVERMHQKYGPIIRVNPDELSIHDPSFYNEVYVTRNIRCTNNYDHLLKGINFADSHFLTTDHDLHRKRRKPLEPFFSRAGVTNLQPMLSELARRMETRIQEFKDQHLPIRLDHVFTAFTGDAIQKLCLGEDAKFLSGPDFSPECFPVAREKATSHIQRVLQERGKPKGTVSLFRFIVHQSDMPKSELSEDRLINEAQTLLGAGTASASSAMRLASYYILSRPGLQNRLQTELGDVMADWPHQGPTWAQLEALPLLQAIVKESLRLSYGTVRRLPRVFPNDDIQYKEHVIPRGVGVPLLELEPKLSL
ncbi:cytochrome P450 [Apiospora kogelbergensis]|uniref:cytochrome P450 n=1 Tax=Apiospora kogelbergensis TaxID=1337665 RepID=UPI003130CE7D